MNSELTVYNYAEHEHLAIQWFKVLNESGDMNTTFATDMKSLTNFLTFMRSNGTLAFSSDEKGMWFTIWFSKYMDGAFWGVWVREDRRHGATYFKMIASALNEAFKYFTVIIGECKQERLHDMHLKLGFKYCGAIPFVWNGENVNYYALTKEAWENRKLRKREV